MFLAPLVHPPRDLPQQEVNRLLVSDLPQQEANRLLVSDPQLQEVNRPLVAQPLAVRKVHTGQLVLPLVFQLGHQSLQVAAVPGLVCTVRSQGQDVELLL